MEGHADVLEWSRQHGCEYSDESILRMKLVKLQLAMGASRSDGHTDSAEAHVGRDGVVVLVVRRHAPCWPEGRA